MHEEDGAKRVARYAHEKASCVLRHEEQLQKLRLLPLGCFILKLLRC